MDLSTLQFLWYLVFIAGMFAYAALDGFDIGVGCLHIFVKNDRDRRIFMNAIGPVWDSNSLWVVITTGAMLAGFPVAFAMLFSGLYLPMMTLVFGYILRGVAIEFRSKIASPAWRSIWDWIFSFASYLLSFGFGIVLANLVHGLPIDHQGYFVYDLRHLISPFSILLGCFTTILFMLHGALFLNLKTEKELQARIQRWSWRLFGLFAFLWVMVNFITPLAERQVISLLKETIWFFPFILMGLLAMITLFYCLSKNLAGKAFLCSGIVILSLVVAYALGTYPNIVRSSINPNYSLTIFNASSQPLTLKILLGMAAAGVPLFFFYIIYTYRVFKGKVEIDTMSY